MFGMSFYIIFIGTVTYRIRCVQSLHKYSLLRLRGDVVKKL